MVVFVGAKYSKGWVMFRMRFCFIVVLAGAAVCAAGMDKGLGAAGLLLSALCGDPAISDITRPGDLVIGVPEDGDWPAGEAPPLAIDDKDTTKYLNFRGVGQPTGFRVTPWQSGMVVGGLTFTTANDAPARDPIAFELYGSNVGINGPYTLIASGEITDFKQAIEWPRFTMNQTPIRFTNRTPYNHYQLMITAVRHPSSANSMQVAEVELLGAPAGGWPPEVDAGTDRIVVLPYTAVQLDGTVAYYGDHPELLAMAWTVEKAPAGVDIGDVVFEPDNLVEDPRVRLPAVAGAYTLKLSATDGTLGAEDTVRIVVMESMCPAGDLDGDCGVDLSDLHIMTSRWLEDAGIGDIDGRAGVDLGDYSLLADNWGAEGPSILINEFMASNNSKHPLAEGELLDEDGQSSDWIELLNISGEAIPLKGWYLTDDERNLTRWELPEVVLDPGAFLVVFASGKNRSDPEGELHTNFALTSGAGYIALVKPDGRTVVHSYAYPPQFAGISYGMAAPAGVSSMTVDLVREGADALALVPEDGSLGLTWTEPGFDHSGWKTGRTGVGYDYGSLVGLDVSEMYGRNASVYIRVPFEVDDLSHLHSLTLRMKYDDGFIAYINGGLPVVSINDPPEATWNSEAIFKHDDDQAVNFVSFPLPEEALGNLRVGTNVLAVHGLNESQTSSDLLITPWLSVQRDAGAATRTAVAGFFHVPSPGAGNHDGTADLGPTVREVTKNPPRPGDADDVVITARVEPTYDAVGEVRLHYRIGFAAETQVMMVDDGTGADATAGDGVFAAVIPHTAFGPGAMIRWYVTAEDDKGVRTREPMFLLPEKSPEYFGTVARDASIQTNMQVFEYFVANVAAAGTRSGTRASVYFLGEFYDNVFIRLRGGNTTGGRKFDFNNGHDFMFAPGLPRVDEINLNERGADPAYIRQPLAWETYAKAGLTASISFPLHVRRNGSYHAVRIFVEQPDTHLIERAGLDKRGALYKVYSDLSRIAGEQVPRKISRLWEDLGDLQALVDGISAANPNWAEYMFDNVNIPAVINYMTSSVIVHENDHTHKNYFLYRDTEGTGEWMFLPWDKDLTFGLNNGIGGIIADQDWPEDPLRSPSHPFYGDSTHQKIDHQWNRLFDAITRHPVTRKMYLRRLRTLMDDILQPTSTPTAERYYERRIDELVSLMYSEVGSMIGGHVNNLKTQYLPVRRRHFFEDHSIHNPMYPGNAGIPDVQPANAVVTIGSVDYNPVGGNQDQEYVELVNPAAYAVDISGWRLAGGVRQTFAPGTVIPAGGTLYAASDAAAFRARTASPRGGEQRLVQGNFSGHLSNWGETLELYDAADRLVTSFTYPGNPSDAQRYLRISEMMYHPRDAEPGSAYGTEEYEFIELINIGSEALALEGIHFSDGIAFVFPPEATLAAGAYAVVVRNPEAFASRYTVGQGAAVFGPYQGQLSNSGETIKLEDASNSTILEFDYSDSWYKITDGDGFSLTVSNPAGTSHEDWGRRSTWRASTLKDGTPGSDDVGPAPGAVVINEVLAHSHEAAADWIELRNTTDGPIHIGGWFLSDRDGSEASRMKYEIAEDTVIPAGGYIVFTEDEHFGAAATGAGTRHAPFALSEGGELVHLQSGVGAVLTGYVAVEDFGASATGVSFGRYEKESLSGGYDFVCMQVATPGLSNGDPRVGPVIMTEIMYNPAAAPGQATDGGEFIELHNITGEPVACEDLASEELSGGENPPLAWETVPWRFTDGIDFEFPAGVSIPAYGYLIVAQDPAAFNAFYGPQLPAGVQVLGPFANNTKLNNAGERVTLSRPGDKEWGSERYYIRVDSIEYNDKAPWPAAADGMGASLQHRYPESSDPRALYTNDSANWIAADPAPGR
ncbi:MAG: lamin tail domain-containing protein [Phycisphaerae bacterium]|nr:lamin tail domain-containing protein [Phycisphaerae bacterium]